LIDTDPTPAIETAPVPAGEPSPALSPSPAPAKRRRSRKRWIAGGLIALLLLLALGAGGATAGAAAWDSSYADRILPGVVAGGVDLSGMTRDEAVAAIEAAYPVTRGAVVLEAPSGPIEITYASVGRSVDAAAVADEALAVGKAGDLVTRLPEEVRVALNGTTLPGPGLQLDEAALETAIRDALAPMAADPVNATVTMTPEGPVTTPAAAGSTVDPEPAVRAALAALRTMDAPERLAIPVARVAVEPAVSDADAAAAIAAAERLVADVKLKFKKKSWTIKAAAIRSWISFTNGAGSVRPQVDATRVVQAKAFTKARKAVKEKPQSAVFLKTKTGKIFGVAPGAYGRKLDPAATSDRVVAELASRLTGAAPKPVKVALVDVEPEVTTEEAGKKAPVMTKLGSWTTWFTISDRNYFGANIWKPAQYINGTVLKPGQSFDWWRAIGPVTAARGFGAGGVIRGSYTDPTGAMGGGMCSSSTTLFNAALRAGLRMGARDNHKYYISRYPLGLDATVWIMGGAVQSMTFTNDMPTPILIRGVRTRSGSTGYVTYEIWGKPDGRKVAISRPSVSNVVKATTRTEYVDSLPKGQREQVEYPANQMDVAVTRVVRNAKGSVIHSETWRTHYIRWDGLIQVGR
jgi:vancomycin resistance protein YoaR